MFKLFIALNIFFLNLFACDYSSCIQKIKDSSAVINNRVQVPLKNNQKLIFSLKKPDAKILKYDPFLNLYLIEDKKPFKYPFIIKSRYSKKIASVDKKMALEGRILKRQEGLNSFATFSQPPFTPALLLNSCCSLEGIVTSKGIIEKVYIERFIKSKSSDYGDIGIRVFDDRKKVVVDKVDIFLKDNPFQSGDIILKLNGLKVESSAIFMRKILFSKIGKSHEVEIQRGSKVMSFQAKSKKRYGGGYLSDTFLESGGLYFSEDLRIVKTSKKVERYALKVGDKLVQIDAQKVMNLNDISKALSASKRSMRLLIERDGFQFFVEMK